jgi:tRNA (Thr-GGU) A37 N-methylase
MSSGQEKSTGARNIFEVYPLGVIEGYKNTGFSVLTIKRRFHKALEGLEEFEEILVIYLLEGELRVHKAILRKLEKDKLYLDYSEEINGMVVIDIKPYFRELDD